MNIEYPKKRKKSKEMLKITKKKYFSITRKKLNINAKNFSFVAFLAQFFQLFDGYIKVLYDDHSIS